MQPMTIGTLLVGGLLLAGFLWFLWSGKERPQVFSFRSRLLVIFLSIFFCILFMVLQNQEFTGTQEVFANVVKQDGEKLTLQLQDMAGNRINATKAEKITIEERLSGKFGDIAMPFKSVDITADNRVEIILEPRAVEKMSAVQSRLVGNPYTRKNPTKPWYYVERGIDLRGGVEFKCSLKDPNGNTVAADETTLDTIRKRLDVSGLTEPQVSRLSSGDLQVVIPGGTEADAIRTRKVIETTGRLEMREVLKNIPASQVQKEADGSYSLKEGVSSDSIDVFKGEIIYPMKPKQRGDEIETFLHLGPAVLYGKDVANAGVTMGDGGGRAISITFTSEGAVKNSEFTQRLKATSPRDNGGDGSGTGRLAVCLDGIIESDPIVRSPSNESCQITGNFSNEEAENLKKVFKAGSLDVKPVVESQRVIGASLGQETITKGLVSVLIATLAVVGIMVGYYRGLGMLASLAMVLGVIEIYAVLVMFGATLTLPGIAGLVLTVGIAVDANILIFERMREEAKPGIDMPTVVQAGFSRAFLTIFDSHLTSFITAFVLYVVGSGPIQGFGLTLMIGLASSMFTAVYVGRVLVDLWYKWFPHEIPHGAIPMVVPFPYVRWRFVAIAGSLVVIVAGFAMFGFSNEKAQYFNIEFTGGHSVQVLFDKPISGQEIDAALAKAREEDKKFDKPEDKKFDKLAHASKQAYHAGFGALGDSSRQWLFKTPDPTGSEQEKELRRLESKQNASQRELSKLQAAKEKDLKKIDALHEEMAKGAKDIVVQRAKIQDGAQVVKKQLQALFGSAISAEGAEVQDASWTDRTLRLDLKTMEKPETLALAETATVLKTGNQALTDVNLEPLSENGIRAHFTWASNPGPINRENVMEYVSHPVWMRLEQLLSRSATSAVTSEQILGKVMVANKTFQNLSQALGRHQIAIAAPFPSTEHFSGLVGESMIWTAIMAILVSLVAIQLYITARFQMAYGLGALFSLIHDVLIAFAFVIIFRIPIDLTVIAAILTIIGYSLNDTVVVFDRIREIRLHEGHLSLTNIVDRAISQTMSRTIMTVSTVFIVVVVTLFFGGEGLYGFSATMVIGVITGTYSTIFIAAPTLLLFDRSKPGSIEQKPKEVDATMDPDSQIRPSY